MLALPGHTSEQRTLSKTQNNHLTGKAPYEFESTSLQRRVHCEPDFLDPDKSCFWLRRRVAGVRRGLDHAERGDAVGEDAAQLAVEIGLARPERRHGLGDRRVFVGPV